MAGRLPSHRPNAELILPDEVIAASRQLLGGIDLLPNGSTAANTLLQAKQVMGFESEKALGEPWQGRVLLIPPGRQPRHTQYITKLIRAHEAGEVQQGVLISNIPEVLRLVPEVMDFPFCIPYRRLRYRWLDNSGELRVLSPSSWNLIVYLPDCSSQKALFDSTCRFSETFNSIGRCVVDSNPTTEWRTAYDLLPLRSARNLLNTAISELQRIH